MLIIGNCLLTGMPRAEWGLDSVIIGVNETNLNGFQDDFNSMMPDPRNWLQTESAVPRITCQSSGNALEFSRDKGYDYPVFYLIYMYYNVFLCSLGLID